MISVIVPVYNVEKYLPKCIESIINQTYSNLEIILVDDGSTDNSGIICDEYASLDKRISVIHKQNGGLSDARNVGLNICKGMYISFIDSDDYIENNMYEKMMDIFKYNDVDIVSCNYTHIDMNKKRIFFDLTKDECIKDKNILFEKIFTYKNFDLVVFNKVYKRQIFSELRFPKGVSPAEDLHILYDMVHIAKNFYCLKESLYNKRETLGGLSHTFTISSCLNNVVEYEKFLEKVKNDKSLDYNMIINICAEILFRHYKHLLDKIYVVDIKCKYKKIEKIAVKGMCNLYDRKVLSRADSRKVCFLKACPKLYKRYRILASKWEKYKRGL